MAARADVGTIPEVTGLVHDYLLVMRGAERTFAQIAACYPGANIYALLYDERGTHGLFAGRVAAASALQHVPIRQKGFRRLLPLLPAATERLDLGDHDVVISSSSAFAHGVRPRSHRLHICYCHSPFRYAWHERERALSEVPRPLRPLLARQLAQMRTWSRAAAHRVDHLIANSRITQERIMSAWGRESTVVYPPVDVGRFVIKQPEDFFLIVGEMVPHKHVAEALLAAERAGRRVKVVGTGPLLGQLRSRFRRSAEFLGRVQDDHLADLMARATALIVGGVEDFGITAVESLAAGRPVIAPDVGGTAETVDDGLTGVLFSAGDFAALAEILRDADFDRFEPTVLRESAERFRPDVFRTRLASEVTRFSLSAPSAGSWPRQAAAGL
jgi:glycosyltransferase involved in cell wall biosynthesis